jgi:RHS repeat-associated protein
MPDCNADRRNSFLRSAKSPIHPIHRVEQTCNPSGNRSNLTTGTALNITYAYDNRDRVSSITGNTKTTSFGYDAAGRRTSATWPNTSTASYGYDSANQLTNLIHKTSGGGTIASFAYRYDANGNRTNLVTQEGSFRFDYDAVNWLVAASYPGNRIQYFDYDDVGNRTNLVDITGTTTNRTRATFNAANRLTQTISGTLTNLYTYDAAGRLTNQVVGTGTRRFTYDFRGQMRSLTDTNSTAYAYEFDGDGNRRKETIAGTTKKFIYDGPNILMELDNANGIEALYIHGPGIDQPIEKISYVGGAADGRFVYHSDALGSVAAITDELQATVRTYTYEAFGKVRATTGTGPVGGNRFTYTAREPLGDSQSLYYYRWRVMDPNLGRFTSEDPLGFAAGDLNLYRYAMGSPALLSDPFGLETCGPWQYLGPFGSSCFYNCVVAGPGTGTVGSGIWQFGQALSGLNPAAALPYLGWLANTVLPAAHPAFLDPSLPADIGIYGHAWRASCLDDDTCPFMRYRFKTTITILAVGNPLSDVPIPDVPDYTIDVYQ